MEKYNHKVQNLTWTQFRCYKCSYSHHFYIPGMHQVGFVVQNVPYFYMFISWCSDKTPFNLTAELQSWRKYNAIMTINNLSRRQNMNRQISFISSQMHINKLLPTWDFFIMSPQCEKGFIRASIQTVDKAILCAGLKHNNMWMKALLAQSLKKKKKKLPLKICSFICWNMLHLLNRIKL